MRNAFLLFIVVLFTSSVGYAQRAKSALLPASEAKALTNQCSRPSPSDFTDTWVPSEAEIRKMESLLTAISGLKAKGCCMSGATIDYPSKWYLQYVGIIRNGQKLIYISAISTEHPIQFTVETVNGKEVYGFERKGDEWKTHAIIFCDGGSAWGVLYDPVRGKFFDLAVNGIA